MWRSRKKNEPVFTGNCYVHQTTGDGKYVGRCFHSTYDGVCHVHGDVSEYLNATEKQGNISGIWPFDYEMSNA